MDYFNERKKYEDAKSYIQDYEGDFARFNKLYEGLSFWLPETIEIKGVDIDVKKIDERYGVNFREYDATIAINDSSYGGLTIHYVQEFIPGSRSVIESAEIKRNEDVVHSISSGVTAEKLRDGIKEAYSMNGEIK
ncbi:hypothetical protein CUC43_34290 (plasmid) [Bacillus thuringiensis LM1212]|uniref:hypothetical protein n=1 Tax=Bacillus cereus group TaxID=86661 RepID=UPI00042883EE|nr:MULTISPECIES: hypothetical protein [Bacillus cereus group]AXY11622.1 hypothetical protein CUC43_34290 [Bacillus thuringiensis LM1212]QDF27460.1 hypothetical protein FJR70_32550 [Bacillus tropicus]QDF27475.1 hypothetical protein FJR70_32635 [Bacillus tropicus]QUG99355.1 hypothetical protein HCM98_31590 [Bacillus tropicus]